MRASLADQTYFLDPRRFLRRSTYNVAAVRRFSSTTVRFAHAPNGGIKMDMSDYPINLIR